MATARRRRFDVEALGRAGALVAICTLVLTASFVGLVALLSGQAPGVSGRLPLYVLGMATAFVGTILLFEAQGIDGRTIIATAGSVALGTFIFLTLGGEGIVHVVRNPGQVVASQLLFYFLAAGMIGTGLGYWGIQHWHELAIAKPGSTSAKSSRFRR
ncbi:hypothetical protein [Halorientalis salina]|uniref:hypothetical protein n=1 Tax=Halorientalis salina TaxID=2932266 RepID=UPI0010AB6857|nr:hypothetical protein [Halorientalis salina]